MQPNAWADVGTLHSQVVLGNPVRNDSHAITTTGICASTYQIEASRIVERDEW